MVEGEIYVGAIIKTEVSPTKIEMLTDDPQVKIKVDTTFLQTIIRGKKSLYYYKNSDGRENFYIKRDTAFELLVYKRYMKRQDDKLVIAENKKYLGQLTLYLRDCETIKWKIENTSYNLSRLIKLFQYYYECSPATISFQREKQKFQTDIGAVAGVSLTSLEFRSDHFDYLVGADYNSSTNFSTGIFFDLILPRNQGKWSIYNEILFSTYKVEGSYLDYNHENDYSMTTTKISYSYLKINNLVRFKYPVGHLFLFLNGGISNGFALSSTNYKKEESKFFSIHRVTKGFALDGTRNYEQSIILGTGVKYDRFSFEFRHERGNGMSAYAQLKSPTKRYYFLFGYRF